METVWQLQWGYKAIWHSRARITDAATAHFFRILCGLPLCECVGRPTATAWGNPQRIIHASPSFPHLSIQQEIQAEWQSRTLSSVLFALHFRRCSEQCMSQVLQGLIHNSSKKLRNELPPCNVLAARMRMLTGRLPFSGYCGRTS